ERLGAGDGDVIRAHGDKVDADRVVLAGGERDLELGADAVGAGDEDRVAVAEAAEGKEAREAADVAQDLGAVGAAEGGLDGVDEGARRALAGGPALRREGLPEHVLLASRDRREDRQNGKRAPHPRDDSERGGETEACGTIFAAQLETHTNMRVVWSVALCILG